MVLESQLLVRLLDIFGAGADLESEGLVGVDVGGRLRRKVIYFRRHGNWQRLESYQVVKCVKLLQRKAACCRMNTVDKVTWLQG